METQICTIAFPYTCSLNKAYGCVIYAFSLRRYTEPFISGRTNADSMYCSASSNVHVLVYYGVFCPKIADRRNSELESS